MNLVLDTSAYSAMMRSDERVLTLLKGARSVAVPVIVLGELESGFRRGNRWQENMNLLRAFLAKPSARVLDITSETAARYSEIDAWLATHGRPIPRNDVWIAAGVLEHGYHLLTLDAHFREIPLLPILP